MATIVTRSGKGSALTWDEADANFTNLNSDKADTGGTAITDNSVVRGNGGGNGVQTSGVLVDDSNNITAASSISQVEKAAAESDVAGSGQSWVKSDTPNVPMFTDDAGTDFHVVIADDGNAVLTTVAASSASGGAIINVRQDDGATLANGHALGNVLFSGNDGVSNETGAQIAAKTAQEWGNTAHGTELFFYVTDTDAVTRTLVLRMQEDAVSIFENTIYIKEVGAWPNKAGYGQIYVKTETPNTLWFRNDAGTDFQLGQTGSGGLAWTAVGTPDQNQTGVVGQIAAWDISSLSADRDFILPDTAAVNDLVGVYITVGDDAFEVDLKTAATASEINGADASSTSWSRLFITNELVIFRCIKAGGAGDTDWIVERDGRIPSSFRVNRSASITTSTAATWTDCDFDTQVTDVGDVYDPTTNHRVTFRRDGNWNMSIHAYPNLSSTQAYYGVRLEDGTDSWEGYDQRAGTSGNITPSVNLSFFPVTDGQYLEAEFRGQAANAGLAAAAVVTWWDGKEEL